MQSSTAINYLPHVGQSSTTPGRPSSSSSSSSYQPQSAYQPSLNNVNGSTSTNSSSWRTRTSNVPRSTSKSVLTIALQKAQSAVLLDEANNVPAAIAAYKQSIRLLAQVMDRASNFEDRARLRHIFSTYSDRIELLSLIYNADGSVVNPNMTAEKLNTETPSISPTFSTIKRPPSFVTPRPPSIEPTQVEFRSQVKQELSPPQNGRLHPLPENPHIFYDSQNRKGSREIDSTQPLSPTSSHGSKRDSFGTVQRRSLHRRRSKSLAASSNFVDDYYYANSSTITNHERSQSVGYIDQGEDYKDVSQQQYLQLPQSQPEPQSLSLSARDMNPGNSFDGRKSPGSNPISPRSMSIISNYYNMTDGERSLENSNMEETKLENGQPNITHSEEILDSPAHGSSFRDRRLNKDNDEATLTTDITPMISSPLPPPPVPFKPISHQKSSSQSSISGQNLEAQQRPRTASSPRPSSISTRRRNGSIVSIQSPNSSNGSLHTPAGWNTHFSDLSSPMPYQPNSRVGSSLNFTESSQPTSRTILSGQFGNHLFETMYGDMSAPLSSPPGLGGGNLEASMGSIQQHSSQYQVPTQINGVSVSLPDPPPSEKLLRPYWLLRVLEKSMVTGGYLTRSLYVPRQMWYQSNIKIQCLETKLNACDALIGLLSRLREMKNREIPELLREMESMESTLENIQTSLAKKLNFIETPNGKKSKEGGFLSFGNKISRSFDKMSTSNKQGENASIYVETLVKMCQSAQILDYCTRIYAPTMPLMEIRLRRYAEFFVAAILPFVVRDMAMLLEKYVKRGATWVAS